MSEEASCFIRTRTKWAWERHNLWGVRSWLEPLLGHFLLLCDVYSSLQFQSLHAQHQCLKLRKPNRLAGDWKWWANFASYWSRETVELFPAVWSSHATLSSSAWLYYIDDFLRCYSISLHHRFMTSKWNSPKQIEDMSLSGNDTSNKCLSHMPRTEPMVSALLSIGR